jgi:uncharacterized protein
MSKFLLLLVAIIVIYFVVKGLARKRRERPGTPGEQMVPCAHCRVNLPRSEAIEATGRFYCSEEHRRLGSG